VTGVAGRRRDAGSAGVWLLACCGLLGLVAAAAVVREVAVVARHQAESAADLAALAGAEQIGAAGDACAAARRIAGANGAHLTGCRVHPSTDGRSGTVRVDVAIAVRMPLVGAQMITAAARAGRVEAAAVTSSAR
jgi:secretion/DNA translocation related TadE-like protein